MSIEQPHFAQQTTAPAPTSCAGVRYAESATCTAPNTRFNRGDTTKQRSCLGMPWGTCTCGSSRVAYLLSGTYSALAACHVFAAPPPRLYIVPVQTSGLPPRCLRTLSALPVATGPCHVAEEFAHGAFKHLVLELFGDAAQTKIPKGSAVGTQRALSIRRPVEEFSAKAAGKDNQRRKTSREHPRRGKHGARTTFGVFLGGGC